jgi:hypothetical protein
MLALHIAEQINHHHRLANAAAAEALEHARQAGLLLIDAKTVCKHGEWLPWLSAHCTVSIRQAQKYIRLAERWHELANANQGTHLTLSGALALLAEPKPEPAAAWLPTGNGMATASFDFRGERVTALIQQSAEHPDFYDMAVFVGAWFQHYRRPFHQAFIDEAASVIMPAGSPAPAALPWQYHDAEPRALHDIVSVGGAP